MDGTYNVAAYMLQIAGITILAELLLRVVPVAAAGFRYAYWRVVLAAALVAPWLLRSTLPANPATVGDPTPVSATVPFVTELSLPAPELTAGAPDWSTIATWVLAAGIAARFIWVAAGLVRLRALRRAGAVLDDPDFDEIQRRLGTRAELRVLPGLPQPVTFGLFHPVVLLPESLSLPERLSGVPSSESEATRRAVVTHELVHVQRRDWVSVLVEEGLRAAFWFHPAIWWLTSRVRLAREEFTDHLTVLATGNRRAYVEALLSFSDDGRLDPAPAFARGGHLFHRIVMLSKEVAMSSRRVVMSGIALTMLLLAGGWYVNEWFPIMEVPVARAATNADLQLSPQAPAPVNSVTPENPIPRRLFSTPIPYPPELADSGLSAAIEMIVVLGPSGSVQSVTRGSIATQSGQRSGGAGVNRGLDDLRARAREEMERSWRAFADAAGAAIGQWQYDPPAKAPLQFYVAAIFTPGQNAAVSQSDTSRTMIAAGGGVRIGAPADQAQFTAYVKETQDSLRRLSAETGGVPTETRAVRVGGQIGAPQQIRKVNPVYPPIAQSARVQGVVILELLINEQGRVANAKVLRSIPLLDQAALDAVYQWEYTPTLLNGSPIPVIMTATVQFTP